MKKILRWVVPIAIVVFILTETVIGYDHWKTDSQEATYYGTVESVGTKEHAVKHGTSTDLYLLVNFDKLGKKAVDVSPTTFYSTKEGERVGFAYDNRHIYGEKSTMLEFMCFVVSCLAAFVLVIIAINKGAEWLYN